MADKLYSQAEVDLLVASAKQEAGASAEQAMKAGADAERARISAITGSDLFKGREAAGQKMIEKGMSSADALELLAAIPVEKATAETVAPQTQAQTNATANKALELLAGENPAVGPDRSEDKQKATAEADQRTADAVATARAFNAARRGIK